MIFTELRFLLLYAIVFALYWSFRSDRARKPMLLVASYVFYGAWDWRFLSLLGFSTVLDYWVGLRIEGSRDSSARKRWLICSLVGNLGLLGFFKYWNFFIDTAHALCAAVGLDVSLPALQVILPVGISFYTFQTLSYTIDVYRGALAARRSLLDFALYVAFFPQLVAGPIVRAVDFLFQLDRERRFADVNVRRCLVLFLVGYAKKACIADHMAPIVDAVFADPVGHSVADNWLGLFLYHVQLYCDFSGYSDMAIGCAGLLGYWLPINFDFPYFQSNVRLFWRKWHISLSSWLKDYVYVPLGGNRGTPLRTSVNLYVTLVLCGLWHGAAWKYVLFGLIHGIYLTAIQWWGRLLPERNPIRRIVHALGCPIMTFFLFMSWIVFRSVDWHTCAQMYGRVFGLGPRIASRIEPSWWLVVAAFLALHWLNWRASVVEHVARERVPRLAFAALLGTAWSLAFFFTHVGYTPFVYFQF